MKNLYFVLDKDGKTPRSVDSAKERSEGCGWARVAYDEIGSIAISTVFLGVNRSPGPNNTPILFESCLLCDELNAILARYETWERAESAHDRIASKLKEIIEEGAEVFCQDEQAIVLYPGAAMPVSFDLKGVLNDE